MGKTCPHCSEPNQADAKTCHACKQPLTQPSGLEHLVEENNEEHFIREKFQPEFQVIRCLGQGGMGVVYEAVDNALKRKVALKILPPELSRNGDIINRFQREAQVAANLNHPHIIPIHSVGSRGSTHYFSMPLLKGGHLGERLEKGLSLPESIKVVKQVAEALAYAHEQGVIHRDIKPQNLMFDEHGTLKVMDFGIAKALHMQQLTATRSIMGTPEYISPEYATGQEIDGRSDLYALGVVFYQLLFGRLPFDAKESMAILYKHVNQQADFPVNQVPQDLENVVKRLLAKDPNDRYQTGWDLITALDHIDLNKSEEGPSVRRTHEKK